MGRSRKCNWKRKQLKGPVMLTGQQYWELNTIGYLDQSKAKNKMMIFGKSRRPGHNPAAAIIDMMKNFNGQLTEDNFKEVKYPYGEPEKLRGGAPDNSYMFRTADGRYIDPELGNIDSESFKKFWEDALPKVDPLSKRIGVPMIFGTAGSVDHPHWAHELWEKGIKDDAKYFIPVGSYHEESGPFPNDFLSRSREEQNWPKDFFEYDPNGRNK